MKGRIIRILVTLSIVVAVGISVGGTGTFVALEVTTQPEFCKSCHNMVPYYESWQQSSHKNVTCVDCHYEPGLLETFEGKFKALSQLAKYVTSTEGSKPWAEVSDYSCMRSGCHSDRLLEGEIRFGRIRFDHRDHLIGLRRDKQLRCTSCHSQIVQGNHLTVTPSTCFLCHFKKSEGSEPIDDCDRCHGPPPESIELNGFTFQHSDYLSRGIQCVTCHADVTRGTGEVPKERCGSCHNQQAHLDRIGEVEFIHKNHVTDHSVQCFDCHLEIQHGLPPLEKHGGGANCTDCHEGSHGVTADVYKGTGVADVDDSPSVMYMARVACTGCHRPPFPGAPTPPAGSTFEADPLACLDCHGPGFEGMAARWQDETRDGVKQLQDGLTTLHGLLDEEGVEGDRDEAERRYARAAGLVSTVMLDRSEGVHNLVYVRELLSSAASDVRAGVDALDAGVRAPRFDVGPRTPSKQGCTTLCHVGVEASVVLDGARGLPFDHARHLAKAKLDCSSCHAAEPHGTTLVQRADCASCHHEQEKPEQCASCHAAEAALRADVVEGREPPMVDFDCTMCHSGVANDPSVAAIKSNCDFCHLDFEEDFAANRYDGLIEDAARPLRELESRLGDASPQLADEVRTRIAALLAAQPFHNPARVEVEAEHLAERLAGSTGDDD
ncbi:MAG: NapC/NirT family cytochrome c [Planctomycetes bacterium]|nr:NapC/NirT family cytochrome c [Planctomycetota bacterium]